MAASDSGAAAGWSWRSTQAWKSSGVMATTCIRIREWDRPQNSVHWPKYTPGLSASSFHGLTLPGTASRLPLSAGIQWLWITSRLVIFNSISCPVGITIWVPVMMSAGGRCRVSDRSMPSSPSK